MNNEDLFVALVFLLYPYRSVALASCFYKSTFLFYFVG